MFWQIYVLLRLRGREKLDPYILIVYKLNMKRKWSYKQAHTCMLMHTTRGPPNFKAGDLDPKGKGGIEKIFRQSLDNVLEAASGVQTGNRQEWGWGGWREWARAKGGRNLDHHNPGAGACAWEATCPAWPGRGVRVGPGKQGWGRRGLWESRKGAKGPGSVSLGALPVNWG